MDDKTIIARPVPHDGAIDRRRVACEVNIFNKRKFEMLFYPVTLMPDESGTIHVTFVDVPEAVTSGANEKEALLRAVDALATGLASYVESGLQLPSPGKPAKGQKTVCLSALQCAKLEVYQAMMNQGMKKSELARRLGWYMPQVIRLFNLKHASRLDYVEAAANVLGKNLLVRVL